MNTTVGKRIAEIRKALKIKSQKEFGEMVGLSKTTISNYENGNGEPDAQNMQTIIKKFNVNGNWLLTGDGEMFSHEAHSDFLSGFSKDAINDPIFKQMIEHMKVNDVLRLDLQGEYLLSRNKPEVKKYEEVLKLKVANNK